MPRPTVNAAAPLVLAIGQFDGVHRGHQAVFRAAAESARRTLRSRSESATGDANVQLIARPFRVEMASAEFVSLRCRRHFRGIKQ